jgi:hypothetical protein
VTTIIGRPSGSGSGPMQVTLSIVVEAAMKMAGAL